MTYILDGIKTAMDWRFTVNTDYMKFGASFPEHVVTCPCGEWVHTGGHADFLPALRFHYTHCPQARLPGDTA